MHIGIVGCGVGGEPHGRDGGVPQQHRLADAVHPVHDAAIRGENDGITQIGSLNQAGVLHDSPASRNVVVPKPERLVEFADEG